MYLFIHFNFTLSLCTGVIHAFAVYNFFKNNIVFIKELETIIDIFEAPITKKFIEQPINHFDEKDTRTFKMRYFERIDLWKPNGPIYIFINGEWEATENFLKSGILYELAKETNSAMFSTEHRYYGKSMPFLNLDTDNLVYLSSRQALADVAKLLKYIKTLPMYNGSKVVVVGGSYSGNLAAWFKLLYPELVDAVIASSAPVLAKSNFYEYLKVVSNDFGQYGTSDCYNKIKKIFKRYDKLFSTTAGIKLLKAEEKICKSNNMSKLENKQIFFSDKTYDFMYQAQYGNTTGIKNLCNKIQNSSRIYTSKDSEMWNTKNKCFNYDLDDMIQSIKETNSSLSWPYQKCSEFGYFMTTSSENEPFTNNVPIDLFYKICTKLFGPEFNKERINKGVQYTNELYGGLKPNVTNVIFTNGDLDPWSQLGVLEDLSYNVPAIVIRRSTHCQVLLSNKPNTPENLKEARAYIKYLIKKWLDDVDMKA